MKTTARRSLGGFLAVSLLLGSAHPAAQAGTSYTQDRWDPAPGGVEFGTSKGKGETGTTGGAENPGPQRLEKVENEQNPDVKAGYASSSTTISDIALGTLKVLGIGAGILLGLNELAIIADVIAAHVLV